MKLVYNGAMNYHKAIVNGLRSKAHVDVWLECWDLLRDGYFEYVDVVYQPCDDCLWQTGAFLEVHTAIISEMVEIVDIGVIGTPFGDRRKKKNNDRLSKLGYPFFGEFEGGRGECDGVVTWEEPIMIGGREYGENLYAPLEVGDTLATTTLWHLMTEGLLARWPYGSDSIYILGRTDKGMKEWRI